MYTEIERCRICGNQDLQSVLHLGNQALTGVFPKSRDQEVESGPVELVRCNSDRGNDACGLVQLKQSYDVSSLYGMNYGYRSGLNPSMVAHLRSKAEMIQSRVALRADDIVLDIGSNDGTFLHQINARNIHRIGMDPTGIKFGEFYGPDLTLVPDFFSAAKFRDVVGSKKARVVTSMSMFYDLESPLEFMSQVADVLAENGVWVCEQSYLPAMLETTSYDTICHEHLEYYGLKQIQFMVERTGLHLVDVEFNDINGGSFSFIAGKKPATSAVVDNAFAKEATYQLDNPATYSTFSERVLRHRDELKSLLSSWSKAGKVLFGYGASTKGNVLLQYCDISPGDLNCIAEFNADKFGSFTPQTLIPIVDEGWARNQKPDGFLVLPWHFRKFIIDKEVNFLEHGGALMFPLPDLEVVTSNRMKATC